MVAAFDYCLHGKGGAAPSIDTAMHGLVDAAHVDHLHPDSGIAHRHRRRRGGADQGDLRRPGGVGAVAASRVPARPGHRRRSRRANPQAIGVHPRRPRDHRLGRHLRGVPRPTRCGSSTRRPAYIAEHAGRSRSVRRWTGYTALPEAERRAKAAALAPTLRSLASVDKPMVGHFTDSDVVLDFLAGTEHPRLAALGTCCPDHFLRTKVKPLVLDLPADRLGRGVDRPADRAARGLPRRLPGLLRPARHARTARRCAAPTR